MALSVYCKYNNEPSGSLKQEEFLDHLRNLSASQEGFYSVELFIQTLTDKQGRC